MKSIIKKIIIKILELESRMVLMIYRPKIIAITGTVGKTTTKDFVYEALKNSINIRKNQKSLNSEIGVPLTILNLETGWNSLIKWLKIIIVGFSRIFYNPNFPDWLVLEVGIDRPRDMQKITRWLKPDIAIITAFGKVPVHVEYFDSVEAVIKEKSILAENIKKGGSLILNADDDAVLKLKGQYDVKTYTYSIENNSDIKASNYEISYKRNGNDERLAGVSFKVNQGGNVIPVNIDNALGKAVVYSILPSFVIAQILEIPVIEMSDSLQNISTTAGRMKILKGLNNSLIIDDSYNASPTAMENALNLFGEIRVRGLKIAVLGDMKELGKYSKSEHQKIANLVLQNEIDVLITVGELGKIISDQAIILKMDNNSIFNFTNSIDAISKVKEFAKIGNIILVKGSQGIRMEKIVKEIVDESVDIKKELIRQESDWKNR